MALDLHDLRTLTLALAAGLGCAVPQGQPEATPAPTPSPAPEPALRGALDQTGLRVLPGREDLQLLPFAPCAPAQVPLPEVALQRGLDYAPLPHDPWSMGIPGSGAILGGGGAFLDLDGDGHADVLSTHPEEPNALFLNDGAGHFARIADSGLEGGRTLAASALDVDGDGLREVLLLNRDDVRLYRNQGQGRFEQVAVLARTPPQATGFTHAAWADFDRDGFVDVHLSSFDEGPHVTVHPDVLLRGRGGFDFEDVSHRLDAPAGDPFAATWHDFDGDGWLDLYVVHDHGEAEHPNRLWLNRDGGARFELAGPDWGLDVALNSMGLVVGDIDLDGLPELAISNTSDVWLMTLGAGFAWRSDAAMGLYFDQPVALAGWAVELADLDHDRHPELITAWGWKEPFRSEPVYPSLSRWDGVELVDDSPLLMDAMAPSIRSVMVHDYDHDGAQDLLFSALTGPWTLLSGGCSDGHAVEISLLPTLGVQEPSGIAVRLRSGGEEQHRMLGQGLSGQGSATEPTAWFGVADDELIDELELTWPDGQVSLFTDLPVDHRIRITPPRPLDDAR